MTDSEQQLAELEHQMGCLCAIRTERVNAGQAMIDRANTEFDRDALPLGRKIAALRAKLAAPDKPKTSPTARKVRTGSHDPEWTPEDIAHYYELVNRGSASGR